MCLEFRRDFFLTLGGANDHPVLLETLLVVRKVADGNGTRSEKAMPARGASGSDAGDRKFQRLAVEHRHDPADRTNKACAVEARPCHGARPCEIVHSSREDACQDLLGGPPQFHLFGGQVLTLGRLDQIKITDVNALLLGEALCRACRRADGIVSHRLGWPGHFRFDVRLFGAQPTDPGSQSARRAESLHRHPVRETFGGEQLLNIRTKFLFGFREHPRRNFFAADLEQEFDALVCRGYLHARASRWAEALPICERYAAAVRQAMVRTRAMRAARSVVEITPRASIRLKS